MTVLTIIEFCSKESENNILQDSYFIYILVINVTIYLILKYTRQNTNITEFYLILNILKAHSLI